MCLRWTETNCLWDPRVPTSRLLLFIPPECRVKREDGEIMKRTLVGPLNQLDDCKNNEAGRGVTAAGAAPTAVCINGFWSLDLMAWSSWNHGVRITRIQQRHSEQSDFLIRCHVYRQESPPTTIVMETRF